MKHFIHARLDSIRQTTPLVKKINYYPNGNIQSKFDVGTYNYDNNHQLDGITNKASSYSPVELDIEYTSYNRASSIIRPGATELAYFLAYGPDDQRRMSSYYVNNTLQKRRIYIGDYEKETVTGSDTKEYDYIYSPEGLSAVVIKTGSTQTVYSILTDYQGSVRAVIAPNKTIQAAYYYDAWGKQTRMTGSMDIINRGYLAQEHLPVFGLINLNARLYDPVLGRFMGVDPYVQAPDFTQSYNRYAYGLNNPLKYTDPDGEFWQYIIASLFFAGKWYYDGYKANGDEANPGKWTQTPNFYLGYSSNGNSAYLGTGWNNSDALFGFGYSFGSNKPVGAYYYRGELHLGIFDASEPSFEEKYPHGVILPYEPNGWEQFRDAGILNRILYNFFDTFWVYGTGALGGYESAYHLSGAGADRTEFENAGIFSWMSLMPFGASGGTVTKGGVQYTKSNLQIGRQMHKAYKAEVTDGLTTFKEFTGIKGIRPDFVDFGTKTIYELKPYNPKSIQQGWNQLYNYQYLFQQQYGGSWNIILEFY